MESKHIKAHHSSPSRRRFLGAGAGLAAFAAGGSACASTPARDPRESSSGILQKTTGRAVLVGSANALPGMKANFGKLKAGAEPLDVAIEVVKITEANPDDHSVGLGGLPNELGVVQLDSAVMDGRTHNGGSVGCIENILHPCEVARLVMERTDHVMLVGRGAYDFARGHGHPHMELLTDAARRIWMDWKETHSNRDDRFSPPKAPKHGSLELDPQAEEDRLAGEFKNRITGTIHCSALATSGEVACTTTTSGMAWKVPGRVGDSPIIGAGLYCDGEAGSAGATGRGESAILSHGSGAIVELLRQGATPAEAGLELMARVTRQAQRASAWQPGLVDENGLPNFNLSYYILGLDGSHAGVRLKGKSRYAVADLEKGPRIEETIAYHE